jgi:hypothetical protein
MGDVRDFSLFCTVDSDLPGKGLPPDETLSSSSVEASKSCYANMHQMLSPTSGRQVRLEMLRCRFSPPLEAIPFSPPQPS